MINRVFIGWDHRQPVSVNVLAHSIMRSAKQPVSITPLIVDQLPMTRSGVKLTAEMWPDYALEAKHGLTPFSYTRFLVPWLCNFEGWALFLDADMVVTGDISELFAQADEKYKAMVVKGESRFEWASAILFNCAACKDMTPEWLDTAQDIFRMSWCKPEELGALPAEWNHCVGYDPPPTVLPKLIHYTRGIPLFDETQHCEFASVWHDNAMEMNASIEWKYLMARSVHAKGVLSDLHKEKNNGADAEGDSAAGGDPGQREKTRSKNPGGKNKGGRDSGVLGSEGRAAAS